MMMITKQQLKELAELDAGGFPVVSFYLNVDGRHYSPIQNAERAHQRVRQALYELPERNLPDDAEASVRQDLDNIVRFVGAEFDRADWRGLALFGCAARQFWQAYSLPSPIADQIRVERDPYVRPLAALLDDYARYGVVLVDREKARLFVVALGEIHECEDVFDEVPSRVRIGSHYGLADLRLERHVDDHIRRHLQHVAAVLEDVVEREHLDRLLICGPAAVIPEFRQTLPQRLADLVVGEIHRLMVIASKEEVLAQSLEAIRDAEHREEAELMRQVREAVGQDGLGIVGLEETLRALYYEAVRRLVVERDLVQPGYACLACGRLFVAQGPCPECEDREPRLVDDIVEAAVEEAFRQDAEVEFVSDAPEWSGLGGIGGLLRFSLPAARSDQYSVTAR